MRRGDPAQKQRKQQRAMVTGSTHEQRVVAIGEVLWDALPSGLFLGGAPLNVACHLQQLGADVQFASRVGDDELGREIARRFPRKGIEPSLLQVDSELPTGFVIVQLDGVQSVLLHVITLLIANGCTLRSHCRYRVYLSFSALVLHHNNVALCKIALCVRIRRRKANV